MGFVKEGANTMEAAIAAALISSIMRVKICKSPATCGNMCGQAKAPHNRRLADMPCHDTTAAGS